LAAAQVKRLENVHDEDWYRNPRAVEELCETARHAQTRAEETDLDGGLDALQSFCKSAS
jgi:hypothetical protein